MSQASLEAYLPTVREDVRDTVRELAGAVDTDVVTAYVREAVARHPR